MKYLIKKILTEERSLDKITDVLLYHDEYDDDEVESIIKLFGGDIASLYHFIDDKGRGLEFLNHLQNRVWRGGGYLIEALQMGDPKYSKEDMDLFMTWIFPMWETNSGRELKRRGDRILLEIEDKEEYQLFERKHQDLAEIMFDDEAMPMENDFNRLSTEDLLGYMTEKNFIGLVRYVGKHNMNEEIDTFREEFDPWIESDNLGERSFLLTPFRLNSFLEPERDLEDRKYNFLVLLDSSDKLADILNEVEWVYSDSYNHVWENDYRKSFHNTLEGLIGQPIDTGISSIRATPKPTNIYDVTDLLSTILWQTSKDGEDPGNTSMFELIENHNGLLTPDEVYYPDEDDEEVIEIYNDDLKNLFS